MLIAFNSDNEYGNSNEIDTVNMLLSDYEFIQTVHDYLGGQYRKKNHFSMLGAKETLENLSNQLDFLDYHISIDTLYNEIKLKEIIKQLEKKKKESQNK